MLELLGSLVIKAMENILGATIDIGKTTVLERRKLFRSFFDLYEALLDLHHSSDAVYREFLGYANGTDTVTERVPSIFLLTLEDRLAKVSRCLKKVNPLLDLYDNSLRILLTDVAESKEGNIRTLRLIAPRIWKYQLVFPTTLPERSIRIEVSEEEYRRNMHLNNSLVVSAFGLKTLDIREREYLKIALVRSEEVVRQLAESKAALGAFIRGTFPLDKVIL